MGVFKVYDDDHSGTLDVDEFISAMELTGGAPPMAWARGGMCGGWRRARGGAHSTRVSAPESTDSR